MFMNSIGAINCFLVMLLAHTCTHCKLSLMVHAQICVNLFRIASFAVAHIHSTIHFKFRVVNETASAVSIDTHSTRRCWKVPRELL